MVSTDSYDGKVISEATVTQVVNAHGGLLSLRMKVESEQKFLLENLKTGKAVNAASLGPRGQQ